MSGIATLTQAFVAAAEGAKVRITDTRKTTPGLRALEKYAVRTGGGANHRSDLSSGVLIKDNHIALVGSVKEAVRRARDSAPHGLRIAVEVDTLQQLDEALEAGAEGVLLDNFQTRDMTDAVKRVRDRAPKTIVEASGGVTLDRMREIGKTGVDVVSIGAITHSARAIDFSCEIRPADGRDRDL
jgi:nicotinate-nucleotide pyrophosphorylase (carboxylating)